MSKKNKAAKFEGMTDDQILAKAKELEAKFRNTPARKRPQDFYDFGNKATEINQARRAARKKARSTKETAFNTGLATTWVVPKNLEQTRNRLAALIMQESGPRADAVPEYTLLGERLVASVLKNYMTKYGLTSSELISGKDRYGGANYLRSITDAQQNPEQSVYDWANDKFNLTKFVQDDTTFNHMTNAVRLASALVNGTLRPLTTATNFKHLAPDDEFNGMTKVDYDFGETPVPTTKVLKLYVDPNTKRSVRQASKAGDTEGPKRPAWTIGNVRNYITRAIQKATPFIDHGLADMYTAPTFDINQMALDAKNMAPRDALRLFYGDKTDEIVDRAMALRARFNHSVVSKDDLRGLSPMNYALPIRNKPSKGKTSERRRQKANHNTLKEIDDRYPRGKGFADFISWIVDRPYASSYDGGAHTAHNKSAAGHERFGHNLNPAADFAGNINGRDDFANDNELLLSNLYALIGDGNAFYTHRNQAEFAAAFGNLRKSIYKRSEGKLDIADPDTFWRVSEDYLLHPGTYSGTWLTDDARELLNTGSLYPGLLVPADKGTIERGYEIYEAMQDPDYTHQFVKASSPNNTQADAKGGDTRADVRAAEGAGDTAGPDDVPVETPMETPAEAPVQPGGPRIVINPEVFEDKRDALCVAMNEAFRVLMEVNGFNPVSEPTEAQRQFFADTAYSRNENQMRRTILARICTFDTSVKDPTNEQLAESVEFLETVMEMGAPQNQWEQQAVQRIHDVLVAAMEQGTAGGNEPYTKPPVDEPAGDQRQEQADVGGGAVDEEEIRRVTGMGEGTSVTEDTSTLEERQRFLEERGMDTDLAETGSMEQLQTLHADQAGSTENSGSTTDATVQTSATTQTQAQTQSSPAPSATPAGQPAQQGPQRDDTGYFRDDKGRVISQREAQKLFNASAQAKSAQAQQAAQPAAQAQQAAQPAAQAQQAAQPAAQAQQAAQPAAQAQQAVQAQVQQTEEPEIKTTRSKYSKLTEGEIAWQKRKAASTAAWKNRTGHI